MHQTPPQTPPTGDYPIGTNGAVASAEDWRPKAIAIMTTAGGALALLMALINLILAFVVCVTFITAVYTTVVGVLCLVKGIPMLTQPLTRHKPPFATAIMQIINILACDFINCALGIVILVLLNDPDVRSKFAPN
jgi:hypothetical protein